MIYFNFDPKKVLILGNGFDLAHALPTRYSDFLSFCNDVMNSDDINFFNYFQINSNLLDNFNKNRSLFKEYLTCNLWYEYLFNLYSQKRLKGENWIDFESEISIIIQYLDTNTKSLSESLYRFIENDLKNYVKSTKDKKLNAFYCAIKNIQIEIDGNIKDLRKLLYEDLNRLTKALEIYLKFIDSIPINVVSKDIENKYDYIINFNYTHTYQRIYNSSSNFFHIHGEVHEENNKELNNMVLGIDEYWSEEERDHHTNFTVFKKFAQRIQKRTGIKSYEWFDEIKEDYDNNNENIAEIFIFGHSLDVTDKDILYDYLESEATMVTIYCKDKETEGEYIANVIKIIGEKRLLEKVNQYPPKLKFVIQQPMIPILEKEKDLSTSGAAP